MVTNLLQLHFAYNWEINSQTCDKYIVAIASCIADGGNQTEEEEIVDVDFY
jgi:hypothetical protein